MKLCFQCNITKEFKDFSFASKVLKTYRKRCKHCDSINQKIARSTDEYRKQARQYRSNHKEEINSNHVKYVDGNKEKLHLYNVEYSKEYIKENKESLKFYHSEYSKKNPGKRNASNNKRRALKINATPKWLTQFDLDYIQHLYIQAKELEKIDNNKIQVDHIIPLNNTSVSGLHVPWNLQLLTKEENALKRNKFDGTSDNVSWKRVSQCK
jgi:hypothetical protein